MKRIILVLITGLLATTLACSGDDAKDAASDAAESATDMMNQVDHSAHEMAGEMADTAKTVATDLAADAVAACRSLAESGNWGQALEVCKKAHELMPDDLGLEHAYQQAQAAAQN